MSDGNFSKADDEIAFIRQAIKLKTGISCLCGHGCMHCCPPITFVVCQSQNNTRVVPLRDDQGYQVGKGGVNVHR